MYTKIYSPKIFIPIFFVTLFFLSFQIKTPGEEAIRTFHYTGISILFLFFLLSGIRFLKNLFVSSLESNRIIVFLVLLYGWMLLKTYGMSVRSLKDFIIGASVDWGLFIVLLSFTNTQRIANWKSIERLIKLLYFFVLISSLLAWLMYFGFEFFNVGHNSRWGIRLHGLLGEPSHFSALVGLGILLNLYLFVRHSSHMAAAAYLISSSFLMATLFASGSRNGIVSFTVGFFFPLFATGRILRKLLTGLFITLLGGWAFYTFCIHLPSMLETNIFLSGPTLNLSSPTSSDVLIEQLRLRDINAYIRYQIWAEVVKFYVSVDFFALLFGSGNGSLRVIYGAAFNYYLESVVNFGIFWLTSLMMFVYYIYCHLLRITRIRLDSRSIHAFLALSLLTYSLSFAFFLSSLFTTFFHFANFTLTCALVLTVRLTDLSIKQQP